MDNNNTEFYEPKPAGFGWNQISGLIAAALVLVLWFAVIAPKFFPPPPPPEPAAQAAQQETTAQENHGEAIPPPKEGNGETVPTEGPASPQESEPATSEDVIVETDEFRVILTTRGATLKELSLSKYTYAAGDKMALPLIAPVSLDDKGEPLTGFALAFEGSTDFVHRNWAVKSKDEIDKGARVVMATQKDGWEIEKTYLFSKTDFVFYVAVSIKKLSGDAVPVVYTMRTFPAILPDDVRSAYFSMTAYLAGRQTLGSGLDLLKVSSAEAPKKAGKDLRLASPVNDWEAIDNRYFTCVAAPTGPVTVLYLTPVMPSAQYLADKPERFVQPNLALYTKGELGAMKPGDSASLSFKVYAGPREDDLLSKASIDEQGRNHNFNTVVIYGYGWFAKFDWLSRMLLAVLNFFASVIPNYGVAIFLLTAAVKLLMFPMQKKGYVSMQKMAALAPQITQLRKKYEHDKTSDGMRRMNMEVMDTYRKNGVSPLGGCLPMLVQLPMFVALYGTLRSAFELRQQGFLWIRDLTQPDNLFNLHFSVPYFEWTVFNLLPILYVGLMVWSTMMQPKPTDPQQQTQRKMMMFMPVMMFFIFYNMPSGLVLYFVFSSAIGLIEQWVIKRHMARDPLIAAMKRAQAQGGTAVALATAGNGPAEHETAWDKEQKREEKERQKREERRKKQQNRRM